MGLTQESQVDEDFEMLDTDGEECIDSTIKS